MRISIVTDELSNDPETAFELGLEWGVRDGQVVARLDHPSAEDLRSVSR